MIDAAMCLAGRDLTEPRLSPDGTLVLVGVRANGRSGLLLVPTLGGPERGLACDPAPVLGRGFGGGCTSWLPDSSGFVYAAVDGQVWWHGLDGSRRVLTRLPPGHSVTSPTLSPDGQRLAYVTDLAEVHILDIADQSDSVVSHGWDFVTDPAWHPDSSRLSWHAWSIPHMAWDESVIASSDGSVVRFAGVEIQQPRFGPEGQLWTVRDGTGWANVYRGDAVVVEESFEHAGPTWGPGQRSYAIAPDGRHVAFARNEGGFGRLCLADTDTGEVRSIARGVHGQLTWVGPSLVALRSGARTPTQVVAYDTATWDRTVLAVGPVAEWDRAGLAEPERVEWVGDDGSLVHGRRYPPGPVAGSGSGGGSGNGNGARRLICWIHGGPTDQWPVSFLPRVAYWADRGWTVLVADHRGSTGHGRAYRQALGGRWGELDVADVAAAIRFAHAQGWGHAETTVLMGGSAGGFTALNVLAHHPELVAGAAVAYPVTDLAALDEATDRFEAHYNDTLVGPRAVVLGRGDGAALERYRDRSPLTHAGRITRPLLILHGDSDPVVPVAQSATLVERIRAAGGHAEFHVYEGEGHGFRMPSTQADEFARIGAFVDRIVPAARR